MIEHLDGYKHISAVVEDTKVKMDKIRSGVLKPIFTSIKKEREIIQGLYPGDMLTIAGRTGDGKSAKVVHDMKDYVDLSINPYYKDNVLVLFDSYEMPGWRQVLRMISRQGRVQAKSLLDYAQKLEEERYKTLKAIADTFKGFPIYVSTRSLNVPSWEKQKKDIQAKYPKMLLIIIMDHLRLGTKSTETSELELITNYMLAGIRLKNDIEAIVIFLSQMNRNIETNVSRDKLGTYLPQASDIFGSDAVFQCSDIVIALHRPGKYGIEKWENIPTGIDLEDPNVPDNLMIECILKNRDGQLGNILLKHNLAHNQFIDHPSYSEKLPVNYVPQIDKGNGW